MATFPNAIKSFTNPTATDKQNAPDHADQHIDANNEINAIETELGTNPKGSHASVKARIEAIEEDIEAVEGDVSTLEGDVSTLEGYFPGTTTEDNVPQWDSATNTFKDGLGVGTAANELVQLDGDAKLPAVDGSQLLNVSSVDIEAHTQTFDADDLTAGVLTLTTPSGYTVIKFYKIYDEDGEEIGSPDGFDKSSLEMDFSSFEDAGILTSATTWTIESLWGPTV